MVDEVADRVVTRLQGYVCCGESDHAPCIVYAQMEGESVWHRIFLQAQIAFWEITTDERRAEELRFGMEEGDRSVDYGPLIGGLPQVLRVAEAIETEEGATHIRLLFGNGRRMTMIPDTKNWDSNFHIVVEVLD